MAENRRQYGSGSLYYRKDQDLWVGSIEAGWTAKGTRRRVYVSARSEAEAKRKLKAKQQEIIRHGTSSLSNATTVKKYAEQWLEIRSTQVRPKTYLTDRAAITKWVIPTIGHKKINELNAADIRAITQAQRKAGQSSSTMNRTHGLVTKMLKDAIIDGANISAGIFALPKPKMSESDRTAMSLTQALAMLAAIENEPDPSRWIAALLNGLRQGERLGLRWQHINFTRKEIDVSWQLQELQHNEYRNPESGYRVPDGYQHIQLEGRWHLVRPKTQKGQRIVPMTSWLEQALLAWRKIAPYSPHDLVWCKPDGGPIPPAEDLSEWKRIQDIAGVSHPTRPHFVIHEARHTTITLLKELQVPDDVIQQIVGQSKLVQSYVHNDLLPASRTALEALSARLTAQKAPELPPPSQTK